MKNITKTLLLLFLPLSTLNALELGNIKLESYLNEPLKASFTLGHIDSDHVGDVLISLADQDAYKSFGITKPFVLNQIKFKISADTKNRYLVNVSTQKRIKDPILDLLVKVTEKQGSVTRLYTLILDPRDAFISSQPVTTQTASNYATALTDSAPDQAPIAISPIATNDVSPRSIKVMNDSLSMLAQNSAFHDKYSVYQIMRAFYLLNKDAFYQGNINRLKGGISLIVPDEAMIAEVSRQQSINFVYSASKNNPFDMAGVTEDSLETQTPVQAVKLAETDIVDTKPQVVPENEPAPATEITAQDEPATEDQGAANTDTAELNSLQQTIIAQQQSEIEQLKLTLNSKLDEIENINTRLNALELEKSKPEGTVAKSDLEIPPPPVIQVEPAKEETFVNSYGNAIAMALALIVLLLLINREFVWRRRLKQLEDYLIESQREFSNKEPVNEPMAAETVETTPKADTRLKETPLKTNPYEDNLNDTFAQTIVEEIHYKPVKLNKSVKAEKSVEEYKPLTEDIDDDIELDFNLEFADDDPDITENAIDIDEESLETLNLKLADEKFQAAVDVAKNFKSDDSNSLESIQDESKDPQILYSEIDVLIAYELYEEAHELIKKSRHDYTANKACLDIRELEILAYLKNADLFFPMFNELKDTLATKHPVEWEKIVSLSKEMPPPGPKLKAVF